MKVAVLCIGDELLKGAVVNTNLTYMGQQLLAMGIMPVLSLEVPDQPSDVTDALQYAMNHADFIITSGGLGPTADDLTKQAIADYLNCPLETDPKAEQAVRDRWNSLKRGELPLHFLNQALIPHGAEALLNACGSAPGIHIRTNTSPEKHIVMLPGPPSELHPMFDNQLLPILKAHLDTRVYTRLFFISGVPESRVEERTIPIIEKHPGLSVAYCASPEFVKLFLTSEDSSCVESAERAVRKEFAMEMLSDGASTVAAEILHLLKERKATLSLAESCSGGLISELITEVPGSSAGYLGGIVSYANEVKQNLLGVSEETLRKHGAVSAECAGEMLSGVAERFRSDCAISVTGIAGPDGGTPEKPVGLVFIGVRCFDQSLVTEYRFRGSREQIRVRCAATALNTLRRMLRGEKL